MTYKEQLQKMSNEELLHEYMLNALNYEHEINIGMNQIHCREELLSRLNEAERLRDMLKLARTHINIFTPMKHRNPELEVLIEQALTTPEGDNR